MKVGGKEKAQRICSKNDQLTVSKAFVMSILIVHLGWPIGQLVNAEYSSLNDTVLFP